MAPLDAALTLAQRHAPAAMIGEYLNLDVPRALEVFLDVDAAVAKRFLRFTLRGVECVLDLRIARPEPHALAAAARHRFEQHRVAQALGLGLGFRGVAQRRRRPRNDRHAGSLHPAPGFRLVAHGADRTRRRTDEDEPVLDAPFGEP